MFIMSFILTANGRAPLEPYYGRYIGNFTEFAHKIMVRVFFCSLKLNPHILFTSMQCNTLTENVMQCFRSSRVMCMQWTNRHYSSKVSLMMAPDPMHSSGSVKPLDLVQRDILSHIPRNILAGNSNFIAFFFSLFSVAVHSKLSFLIPHSSFRLQQ